MRRFREALALAAACAVALLLVGIARGGGESTLVCHGTGSSGTDFVLVSVSGNASVGGSNKQYVNDFPYNPWYASCAEQYADLGNH